MQRELTGGKNTVTGSSYLFGYWLGHARVRSNIHLIDQLGMGSEKPSGCGWMLLRLTFVKIECQGKMD